MFIMKNDTPYQTILDKKMLNTTALQDLQKFYAANDILINKQYDFMAQDESHAIVGNPSCILTPRTHQQISDTVKWALTHKIALVPSGGRTGLSGGACAGNGEVVLSLSKLNAILDFNPIDGLITVEAGVTLEHLQLFVAEKGWFYPVDYASKGSAQIGGAVATNAGGLRVLRYGMTRAWVAGIKAVTGIGETLDINRHLIKDNAGYDIKNLLIGSEGTLAIITQVTLRLTQPMLPQRTCLLGVNSLQELIDVYTKVRSLVPLNAAEFFCHTALQYVTDCHHIKNPLSQNFAYYLLLEHDIDDLQLDILAEAVIEYTIIISNSEHQTKNLWRLRELISSTINPYKPYKNDIACSLLHLSNWLIDLEQGFLQVNNTVQCVWFGHLGDGNVHLNVIKPKEMTTKVFTALLPQFYDVITTVTRKYSATASGEHGVGLLKKDFLACSRSAVEINLYQQIKTVFDPNGILNPGKVLPTQNPST